MILYVVRHAWAGDRDEGQWPDDLLRPLTDDGKKRFNKLLKRLTDVRFAPAMIATSPLVRCVQTAEIIAKRFPSRPSIVQLDALAPGSNLESLVQWTAEANHDEIAWVGHDPDVRHLVARLIGGDSASIRIRKGAVAAIRFEEEMAIGKGELQWLATAKLLGV
ncbi:MAG TPA: phosphoglycerate mutase family protein [Pirellulales bacterium]|nr:phosphoglycerate mutase family protein [Pirellulales bacterium]